MVSSVPKVMFGSGEAGECSFFLNVRADHPMRICPFWPDGGGNISLRTYARAD